jgi:toxin ParE1/3/4
MRAIISLRAQADIEEIWEYTAERWSDRQAEAYLRLINAAVDTVTVNPEAGRSYHDYLRPGYRKYLVGSHVLFYRVTNTDVVVVRILHQRMDVEPHL